MQRNTLKHFTRYIFQSYSTSSSEKTLKKSVYISQSKDIFTNLALEDWLYKNFDFINHHILMLWQNEPCVVIGRHQNPWLEANIANITEQGVKLARRNSGGGTVFHDEGNLNLTFFTTRSCYNRKYNLELITRAVHKEFGVQLTISEREDLTLRGFKVSGTAAKLGRNCAYHHCTLLVNANKLRLSQVLQKDDAGIRTNATKSIKSKIINLCEENPKIEVSHLSEAVAREFGGNGLQIVTPTEECFPGIDEIRETFRSWQWRYGRTPKFTVTRSFKVPGKVENDSKFIVTVENGKISNLDFLESDFVNLSHYIGHQFSEYVLDNLEWTLGALSGDKNKFVNGFITKQLRSCA